MYFSSFNVKLFVHVIAYVNFITISITNKYAKCKLRNIFQIQIVGCLSQLSVFKVVAFQVSHLTCDYEAEFAGQSSFRSSMCSKELI